MTNFKLFRGGEDESTDIQAGSRGLDFKAAVRRYQTPPGKVLAMIRKFKNQDLAVTAKFAGIHPDKLQQYEDGESTPTLPELVKLSKALGVELRRMLEIFQHVKEDAASESMGIAAKFDGQLNAEEKSDLREIVENASAKKRL